MFLKFILTADKKYVYDILTVVQTITYNNIKNSNNKKEY